MNQRDAATTLRALHEGGPLVLPNAWDAASARVIERSGARAIATTSAAISWALGRADGQELPREEMMDAIRRIARAVSVPVTADVEGGYGTGSPRDVAETVGELIACGVAGMNLEDSSPTYDGTLMSSDAHAERISAARNAASAEGRDIVINVRIDSYLFEVGPSEMRFVETVRRANVYRAAGADCIFVPGVIDKETIAALVRAIDAPVNIMAMPGAPTVKELAGIGVVRVSFGPAISLAALATVQRAARELVESGTYCSLEDSMPFEEANSAYVNV